MSFSSLSNTNPNEGMGELYEMSRLITDILSTEWENAEFQLFVNGRSSVFRHTGVKFTLNGRIETKVYALDWGYDPESRRQGRFTITALDADGQRRHQDANELLGDHVNIPMDTEQARLDLVRVITEIQTHFTRIGYSIILDDPNGNNMNCRGFCRWIMARLKKFRRGNDGQSLDDVRLYDRSLIGVTVAVVVGTVTVFIGSVLRR